MPKKEFPRPIVDFYKNYISGQGQMDTLAKKREGEAQR